MAHPAHAERVQSTDRKLTRYLHRESTVQLSVYCVVWLFEIWTVCHWLLHSVAAADAADAHTVAL